MKSFKDKRIAVIGDVMLDRFLEGKVTKKSPEANAPVVVWQKEANILGGAANVAANVKSLGGRSDLYSVIGSEADGKTIQKLLKDAKINSRIIVDKNRLTTVKVRIFADGKYLLRLDLEEDKPLSSQANKQILSTLKKNINSYHAIVLSDYAKGVLSRKMIEQVIALSRKQKIPVIADIKPKNASMFVGVDVVKPNAGEAMAVTGTKDLVEAAKKISAILEANVVLTCGARGMILQEKDGRMTKVKGIKAEVKDIVGAGDVVSASLALALASGESLYDAAVFANKAAARSVEKHGTATVTMQELRD